MKRISFFLAAAILAMPLGLRSQDAAVEEHMNKLSAQIQDLIEAKAAQNKRIEELEKQLREAQDQQGKPNASYATQEELKQLAGKLQEIDEKRQQDNEHIVKELERLGKTLGAGASRKSIPPAATTPAAPTSDGSGTPDKGYDYVIQSGDSLSAIARAYSEKGIKVTVEQILKANPGLKPEKMRVGQKIFIPAAQQ